MTGWRIGYAAGDKRVISAMAKLQGQSTSNPSSISQMAALEALCGPQDLLNKRAGEFERRKNFIVKRLNEIPGFTCFDPMGAFYVFPSIGGFIGKTYGDKKIDGSVSFTEFLLEEAKVAVVPGIAFGKGRPSEDILRNIHGEYRRGPKQNRRSSKNPALIPNRRNP